MIKARLKKLRFATFGFLVLLLALSPVSSVFAMGFGHGFYGTVKVDGVDADIGTVISAQVAGTEYGSWTVATPGEYALIVQGDIDEDATIHFYVDGQEADQTFPFHDGWTTKLDLTVTIPPTFPMPCFIATAAYGTPMAGEMEILREFRDDYLLTNPVGQAFVDFYYRVSPPMAEFITEHPSLKPIVRAGLMPAVAMSTVAVDTTPTQKMVIVGLLMLALVVVAICVKRRQSEGSEYSGG